MINLHIGLISIFMEEKNIFKRETDKPSIGQFALRILPKLVLFLVRAVISLLLWPVYWLGCLVWYRPPNVPYVNQVLRYLKHAWTVSPQNPSLPFFGRIWLSLTVLEYCLILFFPNTARSNLSFDTSIPTLDFRHSDR